MGLPGNIHNRDSIDIYDDAAYEETGALNQIPSWRMSGMGALIFFATPIAAILVMVTVIGIPLGIISLVIWGILLYFAQIPVAITIGWLILSRKRDISSHGLLIGALALGLFILYLIGSIPIIGWILMLFVIFFGLGSLVTVFRAAPNNYKIAATQ